jgi:homoserine O-acetyltransferase
MREKFGRQLRNSDSYNYDINAEFSVETYLDYQGQSFVERFDSNSYLYLTKAADYFDLGKDYGSLRKAFAKTNCRFLIISFASDWLFTPVQSRTMVNALVGNDKDVSYCDIASPYGHDAFLLEPKVLGSFLSGFLDATHRPEAKKNHTGKRTQENTQIHDLRQAHRVRLDYKVIESLIKPNSTVLDIGCGDGELLANLIADKNIKGKGLELEQDLVLNCVNRGLSIIQHDIELGLENFADKSYDYVILSQTVQTIKNTELVFTELLRVAKKVIVSFPNFAHWRCRAQLFLAGSAPVTKQLPFKWHNSPNIHCLSLKDFERFCKKLSVKVEKIIPLVKTRFGPVKFAPNLFAEQVIYVTSKE